MSEINIFTVGLLIGEAAIGIGKIIGKLCGVAGPYQLKNNYVATSEREMLLKALYDKNFAAFENTCLSNRSARDPGARLKAIHSISMFESISDVEPMAFVAEKRHGEKFRRAAAIVADMKKWLEHPDTGNRDIKKLAHESDGLIRKIAGDAHSLLAKAEEELSLKTIAESMSSLAYRVKTGDTALVASKGDVLVRGSVQAGRVKLDTTSFSGISCHAEVRRIEQDLKRRGLILTKLFENHTRHPKDPARLTDPFPAFQGQRRIENKAPVIREEPKNGIGPVMLHRKLANNGRIKERLL